MLKQFTNLEDVLMDGKLEIMLKREPNDCKSSSSGALTTTGLIDVNLFILIVIIMPN